MPSARPGLRKSAKGTSSSSQIQLFSIVLIYTRYRIEFLGNFFGQIPFFNIFVICVCIWSRFFTNFCSNIPFFEIFAIFFCN